MYTSIFQHQVFKMNIRKKEKKTGNATSITL